MVVISKTGWGFEGYDLWNQMSDGLPLRWYPSTFHKCMMIGMVTWILFIGILEIMKWSGGHLEKKKLKKYKYDGEINGSRIRATSLLPNRRSRSEKQRLDNDRHKSFL